MASQQLSVDAASTAGATPDEAPARVGSLRRRTPVILAVLSLCAVTVAGGVYLAVPFWGDQALFTVYARQLANGAVLYRDVFDVKQPGIFLFYALGGLVFGFTEVGIHLLELTYWLAFSAFALVALPRYFASRWAAPVVPVFTVVLYYLSAGLLDLTQVEILVGFPLFVAWSLIDRGTPGTAPAARLYAGAGLAAAAVVLLKHLYLLIVFAFLAYAVFRSMRGGIAFVHVRRCIAAFVIALILPLLAIGGYFAAHGVLGRIWWAYFEMAPAAQLLIPRPLEYLMVGARRFLIGHAPLLVLAVLGFVRAFRQPSPAERHLAAGMMLWLVFGVITFVVLQGWPEYKWTLFTVPLGGLGALGLEALITAARTLSVQERLAAVVAAAIMALLTFAATAPDPHLQTWALGAVVAGALAGIGVGWPVTPRAMRRAVQLFTVAVGATVGLAAIAPVHKIRLVSAHGFGLTTASRTDLQRALNGAYRAADEDLKVLRTRGHAPGSLYVFGDPVTLLRAGQPQPVPILGWGPEFLDQKAWQQLLADLRSSLPAYILLDPAITATIQSRCPPILQLLDDHYSPALVGASGTWYVRRQQPATASR